MFINSEQRKKVIQRLKKSLGFTFSIGELGEKNIRYPVYSVPLDCLILNPLNSRFQVKLSSYLSLSKKNSYYYTQEGQKEIADWIWKQNETSNKNTQKDLKEKGQQKPAIITADGLIINGNRRFVLLQKLYQESKNEEFAKMDLVILKNIIASDTKAIKEKEIRLQFGEDKKLDYSRINTMLAIRDFQDTTVWDDKKIKEYFKWSGSISELKKTLTSIDEYKDHFNIESYGLVDGMEDQFKYFSKSYIQLLNYKNNNINLDWAPKTEDFVDYKFTMFKFLRMKPTQPNFRSMAQIDNKKNANVFVKEEIWNDFKEKIIKIYQKGYDGTNQSFINKKKNSPEPETWETVFKIKTKKIMNEFIIEKQREMLILLGKKRQEKLLFSLNKNIVEIEKIAYDENFKESSKKELKKMSNKLWHINNKISANTEDS